MERFAQCKGVYAKIWMKPNVATLLTTKNWHSGSSRVSAEALTHRLRCRFASSLHRGLPLQRAWRKSLQCASAGQRVIEAVTSASGSKTTQAENIQERTAQILANFKICTEVFAEARSRTSKAMDQVPKRTSTFCKSLEYGRAIAVLTDMDCGALHAIWERFDHL